MKRDIYQSVTDSIIALLESDLAPWRKPWAESKFNAELPFNGVSGRSYSGMNTVLLWAEAQAKGYATNAWLTYRNAQDLGGHVRKGQHGSTVVFWKFQKVTERDDSGRQQTRTVPFARAYTVFNVEQCEDLGEMKTATIPAPVEPDNVVSWAASVGAEIRHGGNRACYMRAYDAIQLPRPEQFKSTASYHATALHELTHSTGHKSRLDRQFGRRFGDNAYAFEELVAEMGSAFLCASIGIENAPLENHASYLSNWLQVLKHDKRAIFTAARHAQQACDFCLEHGERDRLAA